MAKNVSKSVPSVTPKKENGPSAVIGELKKVVWPTRRETIYLTFVVLVVAIVAGIFLGLWDLLLQFIVNVTLLS